MYTQHNELQLTDEMHPKNICIIDKYTVEHVYGY